MLVLTRKARQKIIMIFDGQEIEVTVLGVNGDRVRIGVDADQKIPVHREEVYRRIVAEKAAEEAKQD